MHHSFSSKSCSQHANRCKHWNLSTLYLDWMIFILKKSWTCLVFIRIYIHRFIEIVNCQILLFPTWQLFQRKPQGAKHVYYSEKAISQKCLYLGISRISSIIYGQFIKFLIVLVKICIGFTVKRIPITVLCGLQ